MTDLNLVQKLAKACSDVGGKLKADKRNEEQKYNYVSADKILSACGQALAENGIAVIPSIVKQEITMIEYTNSYGKQGKRYDAVVDLVLKVTDGSTSFEEPWFGMGSDYSVPDKALYKAITSGHKYFISKLFCIGEGNEDSEHEPGEPEQPAQKPEPVPTNGNGHAPVLTEWPSSVLQHFVDEYKLKAKNQAANMLNLSGYPFDTDLEKLSTWVALYKEYRAVTGEGGEGQYTPQEAAKLASVKMETLPTA